MASAAPFQVAQVVLVTVVFCFHLFTFYDLNMSWDGSVVIFEASVYGIYFIIVIGYLVSILANEEFSPPLDAMTKLYGAILFNVLGLMSFKFYFERVTVDDGLHAYKNRIIFGIIKSICAIIVSILYYIEVFQA